MQDDRYTLAETALSLLEAELPTREVDHIIMAMKALAEDKATLNLRSQ